MHYYSFNPSDYMSHTLHLTPMEDLAYRRMMDWCYIHERDLPKDLERIARLIQLPDECKCIAFVLQEYFAEVKNGWRQKRVAEEIKKYRETAKKRSNAASTRWKREKGDANALQDNKHSNANQEPRTNNQEPVNKGQKRSRFVPPTIDEVYNYMSEKGFDNEPQAVKFVNYHTAAGWMVGKNKMKDWKAAVRTWMQNYCEWNR